MNKSIKIISILLIITSLFLITSCKSKYTVTFKDYNGTILKEEVLKEGKDATPPVDPTREGYTFIGWDKDYTNIKEDLIITAQYNKIIKEYTVKFKDYDDTLLKEEKVEEGKNATPPADPTREGYTFIGWDKEYKNITSDLVITAQYNETIKEYTVTFIDFDGTVLKEETVKENSSATPPKNPTREGYIFINWSEDYTNIKKDLIIIALYENTIAKCTITFNTNSENSIDNLLIEKGNKIKEPPIPTKKGYTFIGWALNEEILNFTYFVVTEDITLEAKWEPVKYNLSYELNGGIANNPTTYTVEDNITLNTPTKEGYTFIGWTTEENNIPNLNVNISNETQDKTFTANYQPTKYNITYELNGGIANNPTTYTIEDNITLNTPTKEGYTFIGWTTEENNIPNLNVNISNETQDKTFTANYQPTKYNITYELNGGIANNPTTYTVEDNITLNTPTKEGYTFIGWTTPENNEPFLNISIKNETKNKHFIATWTNLKFSLKENDQYEVTGMTNSLDEKVVIPEYYNQKKITSIGEGAFYFCRSLTSIEIPNSVISIGSYAFSGCSSLTSIEIPNSVTSIGDWAFSSCSNLTSIEIPNSVTSIGSYAFYYCKSLTSIEIPNSVTSIGSYAFFYCKSLTSIEIPNSVTSIGDSAFSDCYSLTFNIYDNAKYLGNNENPYFALIDSINSDIITCHIHDNAKIITDRAFSYCSSLTSIEIPNSVTSIGESAFYHCSRLTSINVSSDNSYYQSIDGNLYTKDGKTLIQYAIGKQQKTFIIPNSVTSIGSTAFERCYNLTSIEIPNSVTSIGSYAFYYCKSLTSIEIPNSVTSIGDSAFSDCYSLTSINVSSDNSYYQSIDGNLYTKDGKTLIQYAIGKQQKTFIIPNSVTSIGEGAFSYCYSLTSIEIPNSVTSIGSYAFYSCDSLTSIKIPNSVTSIGDRVFYYCRSLTSIEIPNSVTSIGEYAFYSCDSLTSINVSTDNSYYQSIDGNLYTKDGKTLIQYAIGKQQKTFIIPNSVTSIGEGAFSYCYSLTSIEIPNSVTIIGDCAFFVCSSLTSIEIPNSVTSIGEGAFLSCDNLTIYCEAISKPSGWDTYWNSSDCPVVWGYTTKE